MLGDDKKKINSEFFQILLIFCLLNVPYLGFRIVEYMVLEIKRKI